LSSSQSSSRVARLHWAQREQVPAALLSGDIMRLPFADNSFDKILMSEVLEHISDDRQALGELFRVVKPGGILALSVPHARFPFWWDPINPLWIALGGQPIRSGPIAGIWSNHERLYTPEDLRERIAAAGFEVEILEEATHYSFPLIHFLVYGIGKPLLEHDLLPGGLRKSADRFAGDKNSGSLLNPINLGVAVFRWIDRLNDRPGVRRKRTFVNVLVKARKPAADQDG
jgi:SAM-dependent methyltransferase